MNIADALSRRTIIKETRTTNVAENGVQQFVANTAVLKAMTGEETEATSGVDDGLESLRQCIKTGNWENASCSDYKSVRDELCIFGNMVLSRNKNSGTKEIWSKSNWVRSWLHQGILRMKQQCGDQNLIRKPRSFAKHVMGDKLGVDQAVLNLATWLRCLSDPSKKLRFISWVHRLLETTFSLWLTITVDTWKLVFSQETQLKWPSGAYRRCLPPMDFPILWQVILVPIFCDRIVWNILNGQRN